MLKPYIEKIAEGLGITVTNDEARPNWSRLSFDGMDIDITENQYPQPEGWEVSTTFGTVPSENREALFVKMLLGNLFGQGTRGAVLGLDEEAKKLILRMHGPLPRDYQQLHDTIEDFANVVEMWNNEVAAVGQ
jgi:hypothetical protein